MFDRFYQVESKINRITWGRALTGLVKTLYCYKGSISIYSERGAGSDFVVKFPISADHTSTGNQTTEDLSFETESGTESDQTYPDSSYKR